MPAGELQPGKPRFLRQGGNARQRRPGLRAQFLAVDVHAGKALAQADHQPPHAAVADDEVGAFAHQQGGRPSSRAASSARRTCAALSGRKNTSAGPPTRMVV